jgi:hypothetical protein
MQPGFDRNAKRRGRFGFEVDWYIGVCPDCQKKVEVGAPLRTRLSVEQERARYQVLIREQRTEHPDWPLKKAAQAAGKEFHHPRHDFDRAFRAYLLDSEAWSAPPPKPSPFDSIEPTVELSPKAPWELA